MRSLRRTLAAVRPAAALALILALAAGAPRPAAALVVDGVAAVVNGEIITLLELEKAGRLALEERLRAAPPAAADQESARREVLTAVLDQLVMIRIQTQRARQAGIQVGDPEVDAAIAAIREESRMGEEVFARVLEEQGIPLDEYRREIADRIRIDRLIQREIRSKVAVPEAEVNAWFAEHRGEWSRPARIRVRHLLVPVGAEATPDDVAAARAHANALYERAKGGADFAALVRAETPGAAADADEVSGELTRGELFPALEAVAFALPVGGVGEPVQSPSGFHLVQIAAKTPAYEAKLEDVRMSIEQKITERLARQRYDAWLKRLRAEAIVEIRY